MVRKLNLEVRELWRQRIEGQGRSGLTVAEFCRREGVPQGGFYTWKRKLRGKSRRNPKRPARRQPAPAVRPVSQASSKAAFLQVPLSSMRTSPWIELVLPEGAIIRLPQQNLAALKTVLHALDGGSRWRATEETRDA